MMPTDVQPSPTVDSIAHIVQVALTPVFLLSGIASLLGVFAGRLARVADKVDAFTEKLETADIDARQRLTRRLAYLRRRSHLLDYAVLLGAAAGSATCAAAASLFFGALRETNTGGVLFVTFGLALLFTVGALSAFMTEMLLASRGVRDEVDLSRSQAEADDAADADPESTSEPSPVAPDAPSQ